MARGGKAEGAGKRTRTGDKSPRGNKARTDREARADRSAERELTLKDRLSRLTYEQACRWLGPHGAQLIRAGGAFELDLEEDVYLGDDLLRVRVAGAVATITTMSAAPQRLHYNCTHCDEACEHVGAALSLVLEEKTALGLAVAPTAKTPLELLSEAELVQRAIHERLERAQKERLRIEAREPKKLWSDYLVTNQESGRTYRVALRGWEPGDSFCSCPDYRKNTLGVCKHIFATQCQARKRFSAREQQQPYQPERLALHLRYGPQVELRLTIPDGLEAAAARLVEPLNGRAIEDLPDLMRRLGRLAALGADVLIYPDAEEYIQQRLHAERVDALVAEIRRDPKRHPLRRELLKTELLPYQLDGVAFAVGAGRAILADEMGLGKTIQGIGVAALLRREFDIRRVLVICPASLKSQWLSEIERFSELDGRLVLGGAAERAGQYEHDAFFTICNYEQVLRDILAIERVAWDLIILDEAQRIKNWEAQTARVVKGLRSRFALVLSGTPLENRLEDLFSVMEFVDERRLGPAFRFFHRHRMADETGRVAGYKNLAELRARLAPVLLRRTRALVLSELPPRSTEIVRVVPTDEQMELHSTHLRIVSTIVRKPYISEMDLLRLRKALLMCRMAADSTFLVDKRKPGYSSKLAALDELLTGLLAEADRKIIVFSEWTTMLDLIQPLLDKFTAGYVRLDGSVPQQRRIPLVQRFQKEADCRVLIATNAGATGLNLQAANTVINVDLPWNPAVLEQRIARAHRMGQKSPVQAYVVISEGTIEENLLGTLSAKHELAQAALDADSEVEAVSFDRGIDQLKNRLEVLLGAKPVAPLDESVRGQAEAEAERLARRDSVALAGGQLLTAALSFVTQLLPAPETSSTTDGVSDTAAARKGLDAVLKQRLMDCVELDPTGRARLTLTLPDAASVEQFATTLARLVEART